MATALDALLAAMKVKWDASASLNGINGPYRKRKPPNLQIGFPYAIIEDGAANLDFYTCPNEYWTCPISLVIYQSTPELCAAAAALIDAVFNSDALALTISGGSLVKRRKIGESYSEDDKAVQSCRLDYEFQVSKNRTA